MSTDRVKNLFQGLMHVTWRLICVWMLTAFLGLVAVRTEYYSEAFESGVLFGPALGVGVLLSMVVILMPIVRWLRAVTQKPESEIGPTPVSQNSQIGNGAHPLINRLSETDYQEGEARKDDDGVLTRDITSSDWHRSIYNPHNNMD